MNIKNKTLKVMERIQEAIPGPRDTFNDRLEKVLNPLTSSETGVGTLVEVRKKILFCLGNISMSPMTKFYFKKAAEKIKSLL